MTKSLIGVILIAASLIAYSLYSVDASTPPKWETEFDSNIFSEPVAASDNFVFWGGNRFDKIYKLFVINSNGQKISESQPLPSSLFDPVIINNKAIVADHARMLRAFSLPDLKVVWEAASNFPFEKAPIKCGDKIFQGSGQTIYCFDSLTGQQLWDITERESIKNYAIDKVIISIHGYNDLAKPLWKCSAYDINEGEKLWELNEPVSNKTPLFVRDTCILTTIEGEGIILNQHSGEILTRTTAKGLVQVAGLDDSVIFASSDFKNIVYISLATGKSWTTTIKKDLIGAIQVGSKVVIADKENLRCFDVDSGSVVWQKELGDVYGAYPHRSGAFIVYKKGFTDRETYGACIDIETGENLWLSQDTSIYRKPYPLNDGDLLVNNDGTIRLMPKPIFKNNSTISMPQIEMPDPAKKINQVFENKTQTPTIDTTNKTTKNNQNKKAEQAMPIVSDEDAGW